jgi:membrane protein
VSGDPGRKEEPARPGLIRRVQAAAQSRIDYWQNSALARRLQSADVINRGILFAAVLLLCFVPFLLVLESLIGRSQESGLIQRFGLTDEAASAVRHALTSPSATSAAISGLSWVFFVVGGIAAAAAIQELYERVFEVEGRGFRGMPQRIAWLAVAVGVIFLNALAQPWLHSVGGTTLVALFALIGGTTFWWFSMWLLLGGRLGWGELFPSALATGICFVGMEVVFRLTLSSTIVSNYNKYGSIGVVFAIMSLLIAIGVVIMLGALLGIVWRERYKTPPQLAAQPRYDLAAWPSLPPQQTPTLSLRPIAWTSSVLAACCFIRSLSRSGPGSTGPCSGRTGPARARCCRSWRPTPTRAAVR